MDWRPIETAPKDRTCVLVYGEVYGEISGRSGVAVVPALFTDGASDYGDDGFWNMPHGDAYAVWVKPTHWMPLPAPPKSP